MMEVVAEVALNAVDVVAVIVAGIVDVGDIYCAAGVVEYWQHEHVQQLQHDDVAKEVGLVGMVKAQDDGVLETLRVKVMAKELSHDSLQNL